ncbi:hypothetical protein Tco_0046341 [Tanacetum coccineum]
MHSAKEAKKFCMVFGEVDQTIPQNSAFQIEDLDAYDSDCDDISLAKSVLMENLSSCDSDVLSKDDTHKQALGYQNLFHLKKARQIKPILYDGSVIAKEHDVIFVIDDEETMILEEEKQAFWLKHSNYNPDTSVKSHTPVRIKAPSELPKVSLVNESLKKLNYQLTSFDKVVKKRTTSDAITVDEIIEVQTIFNQIEVAVDQCSADKNTFEIQIKQLSIDNDQLLK